MSRTLRATFFALALAGAVAAPLTTQAAVDLAAFVPPGPQVKVGRLPNGLTYYIQRNAKPEKRIELRLAVKAGSVLEDPDQQGLAHFLEHVVFGGTAHLKKHELISWLQSIGLSIGADLNAYTTYDETVYILPVPTDNPDNVDKAFTVLEDWAHGVTIDDADIAKERPIVLEEARQRKGAGERLRKLLLPTLFNGSRYAERDPIGKEDVIKTFPAEALRRFYRDWYRPDLMAVVVVGDIDPLDAERMIRAHFGPLANPSPERPRANVDIPPLANTEALVMTDSEVPNNSVLLRYPIRFDPERGTYGSYRDKTIENLFGMMLNQRLSEVAQQPGAPFVGAAAGMDDLTPRHKVYAASAGLGAGGAAPAIAALLQEQQRVRQYGFTQAELDRAAKVMLRSLERGYNERTTTDSSTYAAEYLRNFLADESIPGIEAEYRLAQELLPGIRVDDVNAFARKAFPLDSGKLVLYVGGTKAPAPSDKQLLAMVAGAEHLRVDKRNEKALATRLMERPAKPGGIVDESRDDKLGLTRLTLSNGVKVILKPTTFNKDQVLMSAQRFGGQTLFDEKDIPNARYASTVAGLMGAGDFSPTDLQKILAGKAGDVGMGLGNYTDDVQGRSGSSPDDIETMFQVLWLRFNGVRRDENLYKSFIGKQQELVRNRLATPEARFSDAIVDAMYNGHPYEPRAIMPQDVDKVDLDRSVALYRQRFASAKGLTFILVGDFDVAAIKPLLASYLGTLPTPDLPLAYRDVGLRPAKGVVRKEVKAGAEPKSIVSLHFTGPAEWSPAESLRLSAMVEVLNLRVFDVLRERLGLIYGGSISAGMARVPYQHYEISATLPTGPEKVDQLVAALFAEVDRV
jgi:zinc protease